MSATAAIAGVHGESLVNYKLIKSHLFAGALFLTVSMVAGYLYSLQFLGFYPLQDSWTHSPGHFRLLHTNMVAYGWLVNGFTAMLYYVVPRLTGKKVLSDKLGVLIFWAWQLIMVLAIGGYMTDKAQAIEWGETPTGFRPGTFELNYVPVDALVVVGAVLVILQFMTPLFQAREQRFYVTLWYITAGLVWLALTYLMGNIMPEWMLPGAAGAAVTGLFIHDLVGLYVTPMGWGMMYFFVPLILRKPIWSHSLSVIGFWALAFFYPLGGVHHFLISPIPDYVEFGAITTTIAIEVVVTTVVVNFFMTLRGKWSALRSSMAIRWFYVGAVFYFITCFQCAFQVTWMFQKVIHFTDWVVGHAHLIMFGVFTFWLFGVIEWLWPRVCRRNWYSQSLRGWHFWLWSVGVLIMFFDLMIAGLVHGFMQRDLNDWSDILRTAEPFWWVRTFSGAMILAGLFCVIYNMYMTAKAGEAYEEEKHLIPLNAD
ncbi:MAG: cbb3-type cytochrome c oxidase subunit I [Planctomycetes bacterium]|nr:cbb3-type cytochrome c oxidase subunit I [Planctomycetota bacterium]